jgi:transcriptional regulator with GAF, ATPase, and Fis domain
VTIAEERFYRLLEIYRQINSELDRDRLLNLVMDTAVELTGAERGFLLLGGSPDTLQVEVARNLKMEGQPGEYSRSIAEQVFSTEEPVITVSAHNDPRFQAYMSVHQMQLESVLCIPIHARGETVGVLYMESRFQSGRFTPKDQRLLMAFGDQVAIALTNARLLQDNMRKAEELERAKLEIEALAEERGRLLAVRTQELEEARRDLAETRRHLEAKAGMFGMIGRSAPMARLFQLVERVASTDVPVIVEGESGTGKEMVARAIHNNSSRREARMVSVNCAAIPENLLESELFGHVRGAFTGADRERKGLFSVADNGTLFLDEIGDMPARMQVDLLRALQEKTIRPVGAQKDIQVDVRVIAASNRPLADLVRSGAFREDLYYRLNVVTLKLPPLRERADDIPLLVDHFLAGIGRQMGTEKKKLTRRAMQQLVEYGWPGNVRQLEHTLMNAAVLAESDVLDEGSFTLEAPVSRAEVSTTANRLPEPPVTEEDRRSREKQQILEALEACNWNKSKAARELGMPRRTFYRRLKDYGVN